MSTYLVLDGSWERPTHPGWDDETNHLPLIEVFLAVVCNYSNDRVFFRLK